MAAMGPDMTLLDRARDFATKAHAGQKRFALPLRRKE